VRLQRLMTRGLKERRIVVTRAREQSADLVRALEGHEAEAIVAPVIRIQPVENLAALRAALSGLSAYRWVVFTSQNAVQIVLDRLVVWGLTPRVFAATSIAAVGSATADMLKQRGLTPALVPEEYVAEALVSALERSDGDLAGARVLIPSAEDARDVLAVGLRRLGAVVESIPVYRTVPVQGDFGGLIAEIIGRRIDAVTFMSSSTVRSFVHLVGPETATSGRFVAATIGPITAGTARELGLRDIIEAHPHTVPGLVDSLVRRFA
jgi:uroporphyrinogen-III synthase